MLHVLVIATIITGICIFSAAMSAELSQSTANGGETPSAGEALGGGVGALLLVYILTGGQIAVQLSAMGAAISSVLVPVLVIFGSSLGLAVLSGYSKLRWLRWLGFALNLAEGGLALILSMDGPETVPLFFFLAFFFFVCAALFALMPISPNAERNRLPVAVTHLVFGGIGLLLLYLVYPHGSVTGRVIVAAFYMLAVFLHYKTIRTFNTGLKKTTQLVACLGLTLVLLIGFLLAYPVLLGVLLLSLMLSAFFAESMFVCERARRLEAGN